VRFGNKYVRIQTLVGAEGLVAIWAFVFSLCFVFFVPFFLSALMLGLVASLDENTEELFEVGHLVLRF
jgi:hypothetical protein